ncbi:hypothetical protein GCM10023196_067060 [Actinoallomurus vinaceus]|uniref:Uncharacterized protein n=1 Tax=Actinoallomurus vinaceus TaxID=1080074 RepID=A0ABP8UIB2_9ACTN
MVLKTIVLSGAVLTAVIGGAAAPAYAQQPQPPSNSNFGNVFDRDSGGFVDRGSVDARTQNQPQQVSGNDAAAVIVGQAITEDLQ